MLTRLLSHSRRPAEFALLLGLAFFLPLYEAPKNIFWVAFAAVWLANRWRGREWGGPWEGWDTLILAWILSGYVVAAFAGLHKTEWDGANDILRYGSVLWLVRRGGYSGRELGILAGMLVASCVVGLVWGYWRMHVAHTRVFMELHSVGHSNHSAPYIAMIAALSASAALHFWHRAGTALRVAMAATAAFIVLGLLATSSRGAVGAFLAVPFVLAAGIWPRSRRLALSLLALTATAVTLAVAFNINVVEKQQTFSSKGDITNGRITIWRRALVAWEAYPWFGVGIDNFGRIDDALLRRQVEAKGGVYRAEDYIGPNHAHSLYFNTLAERGLVGGGIVLAVLAAWATSLWRGRPRQETPSLEATYWSTSASALVVVLLAGVVNTSFHHEIALLAMIALGGWMASRRGMPGADSGS